LDDTQAHVGNMWSLSLPNNFLWPIHNPCIPHKFTVNTQTPANSHYLSAECKVSGIFSLNCISADLV
jgi:hypothetical protein